MVLGVGVALRKSLVHLWVGGVAAGGAGVLEDEDVDADEEGVGGAATSLSTCGTDMVIRARRTFFSFFLDWARGARGEERSYRWYRTPLEPVTNQETSQPAGCIEILAGPALSRACSAPVRVDQKPNPERSKREGTRQEEKTWYHVGSGIPRGTLSLSPSSASFLCFSPH